MHIACAANLAYVPHCAAMLSSVLSQHEANSLSIHFLYDDSLPESEVGRLAESFAGRCRSWQTYCLSESQVAASQHLGRYGKVAWYRVMLPSLLHDVGRVIYLDADVIVERALFELWSTDLEGKAVGAVVNPLYPFMDKGFLARIGVDEVQYFNSGMLLMDLQAWRARGLSERVFSFAATLGKQEWPDQNALNAALRGECLLLAPKWNSQNTFFDLSDEHLHYQRNAILEARESPAIVHFIGPYKPWHFRCKHSFRQRYWFWRKQTPWDDRKLDGVNLKNGLLRMLPELLGLRIEFAIKKFTAGRRA